ncbi:hypothetical protein DFJ58DRAFT_727620 [Suillus subalutaceus]|uniref:uncharacterized protein n=1 Tax=Suillus subalutaceus TaxID=48586 RepID=UPI001B86DE7F|nr:uncharacterized protein DFJ58DRAFT_727620 [Suillus subalutaceus]KAG1855181.1 hypothetical protein DFJ58DRAFT_727620 [Suillus subalutaceus]
MHQDDGLQPVISPAPNTKKKLAIHWEGAYSAHTSRLIAWCKANDDARIKLFSDSVKDAKDKGRKKKQSAAPKETCYSQLANAIFSNDEDPEFNKSPKQTGAGLTYDELQKNLQNKMLIDSQLDKFPWWPDLHGWWRTNPAYNTVFSTADPGQNYKSAALQHFRVPDCEDAQLPADENEPQEDADVTIIPALGAYECHRHILPCLEEKSKALVTSAINSQAIRFGITFLP